MCSKAQSKQCIDNSAMQALLKKTKYIKIRITEYHNTHKSGYPQ